MATDAVTLPEGFTLDAPTAQGAQLPEGFTLDAPQAAQEAPAGRSLLGQPVDAQQRPGFFGGTLDVLQGSVEVPASMVTGLGASVVGGYRGIADYLQGATPEERAKTVEETQQKYTYQPRGAVGQAINADLSKAFGLLNVPGEKLGEAGYPAAGAAVTGAAQTLPMLLAPEARGAVINAAKGISQTAKAIPGRFAEYKAKGPIGSQVGAVGNVGAAGPAGAGGAAGSAGGAQPPKMMSAESSALRRIAMQVRREYPDDSPAMLADRLKEMSGLSGGEARVADVVGRDLLDLVASLPGETPKGWADVRLERIKGRPERLDPVVNYLNGKLGRAGDVTEALTKQQKAEAGPLYDRLHATSVKVTPELLDMLQSMKQLGAVGQAQKLAVAERRPLTVTEKYLEDAQQQGITQPLSMRDLDIVKRGMDDAIEAAKENGRPTTLSRAMTELNNQYKSLLDNETGGLYGDAREAYAGPAAIKSAIEQGRNLWRGTAESMRATLKGMSESERQGFRVGAAESFRETIGSPAGQNKVLNLWKDRTIRERLREVFGNEEQYDRAVRLIENESKIKSLESVAQNSKTFGREAMADDAALQTIEDLSEMGKVVAGGGWDTAIKWALKNMRRLTMREETRNQIGKMLLSKDESIFSQIEKAMDEAAKAKEQRGKATKAAAQAAFTSPAVQTLQTMPGYQGK
jgi:hypothetical protein